MENPLRLYHTLVQVLRTHRNWLDVRRLRTLAWMMTSLIQSGAISLAAWVPYVHSRAVCAQSTVRRFRRWLSNRRIEVHSSSSVAYEVYRDLLPLGCRAVFLADRGFADIDLLTDLKHLGWHYRIRIKGNFLVYRCDHRRRNKIPLACGQTRFWHSVTIAAQP